nr:unnamed protein product [Callosobruchus analis]
MRLKEKCYSAEILYQMYCDDSNYAYLCFLKPILSDVNRVNKNFEPNFADPMKLMEDLSQLLNSLISKVTAPHSKFELFKDTIEDYFDPNCYLGYLFESQMRKMKDNGFGNEQHIRDTKVNKVHWEIIVSFMEQHPELARGRFNGPSGREMLKKLWKDLALQLNSTGLGERSVEKWQKTWTDFKYLLKKKASINKRDIEATGGGPPQGGPLSEIEDRALHLLGATFYEGIGRPENGVMHMKTHKHTLAAAPSFSGKHLKQATLQGIPKRTYKEASAEVKLAMFVANHCAIMSIDHLVSLCKSTFSEAKSASQMRMHRTKCSGITQCCFTKYSLFLDESTDISVQQLLGIGINYFDGTKIVSTFLVLAELKACDAHSIASAIKDTLDAHKLPLNQLVGIATDNASTVIGINNGLFQILKQDVPNLILIKCVCHSLQLAVSHAVTELCLGY